MSGQYEELCAAHRWNAPQYYNIAANVCDKHPRDKLAMVWESFDGSERELAWGELQDLANQAAHTLADLGVGVVAEARPWAARHTTSAHDGRRCCVNSVRNVAQSPRA